MEKLVSIVLPVYNGSRFLRESIDSVIAQTYENWELLILDDCSTDESPTIAQEYVQQDRRIKYFRNESNLRLPRNLNKGFSFAQGDFLTWTSDDNRYKPTALQKMVQKLNEDEDAQFVFASCRIINELGEEVEYITVNEESKKRIVGSNSVGACFMYTRKAYETVGEYDPELTLVEDFDYWQRIMSKFKSIALSETLYEYRWHDGALTSTMRQDLFNQNLEKMLLKNIKDFGRLDIRQKYSYYKGLNTCREKLKTEDNPYKVRYNWYKAIYCVVFEVPNKIKRAFQKALKSLQARTQTYQSKHFEKTRAGRNLKKYKNSHKGETCFFIGNGPSLKAEDLDAIKRAGYPTFAFNRIYYIFDQTDWRPTYYISQDEKMLAGCKEDVSKLELPHKFVPVNMRWHFDINVDGVEEFYLGGSKDTDFWFTDNFPHSVCWAHTVMYTAAQFAAYMGFKKIYLLGVDHHFHISRNRDGEIVVDDSVKDYFSDKYNQDKDKLVIPSTDISTDTYYAMKKHCDARGIEVYNATRGGKLEVFERVNFDDVINKNGKERTE